jgi:ABC-2 type transport system ATP-binding protein
MKGDELINLARVLRVPITKRTIQRSWLVDEIIEQMPDNSPRKELHDPAIEIAGVSKNFGKTEAVKNLDLKVHPGEILGLVGPNGAGKTTTLRMLTGIIRETSGDIFVNNHNIKRSPLEAKRSIGYIPEKPTCYPSLTAREYVTFVARVYGVSQETALIRTRKYVDLFDFDDFIDTYIGTLSKGNLQRALLVGIFVREPPYILALDEPIYGLDPRGAWNLKKLLKQLRDDGSAILISTHILEVATDLCDRFAIMNEGDVVGRGTLEELTTLHPEAKSLEEVFLGLTGGIPE